MLPTLESRLTSPAQKISLGHHACFGGNATWDGRAEDRGALGLATTVETVTVGGAVAVLPCGRARATWKRPEESAKVDQQTIVSKREHNVERSLSDAGSKASVGYVIYLQDVMSGIFDVHQLMTFLGTPGAPLPLKW